MLATYSRDDSNTFTCSYHCRRRMVRKRRRVALPTSVLDVSAAGQSTGSSSTTAAAEQWQRRVSRFLLVVNCSQLGSQDHANCL